MAKVQFFSQKMIDDWAAQQKVVFDGETLIILVEPKAYYKLKPVTRFIEIIEGEDIPRLKGKVLTQEHLESLKADVYLDSAIIGEKAYKVEPGFVVDLQVQTTEVSSETDSLTELMLNTLSNMP